MAKNNNEKFDKLREEGYRITPQRKQLLELFHQLPDGEHLSAEELHSVLLAKEIQISLATLYRSLKFLVEKGFIRELDFGEYHKHYELRNDQEQHHHMVCNLCGLTVEIDDKNLYEYAVKIAKEQNNFQVKDYQFKIFGICENCARKQ
jgi:Fur family ferric uptake transcriptional regulator